MNAGEDGIPSTTNDLTLRFIWVKENRCGFARRQPWYGRGAMRRGSLRTPFEATLSHAGPVSHARDPPPAGGGSLLYTCWPLSLPINRRERRRSIDGGSADTHKKGAGRGVGLRRAGCRVPLGWRVRGTSHEKEEKRDDPWPLRNAYRRRGSGAARRFYGETLGLELGLVDAQRRVAFYWVGGRGEAMLGLWEKPDKEIRPQHFAFRASIEDILTRAVPF